MAGRHAARRLMECASLSSGITDFGGFDDHNVCVAKLRREHGKKPSFWGLVA